MAVTPSRGAFKGETFRSYRQYRNALARRKGFRSWYQQQRAPRPLRRLDELAGLHPEEREARARALEALSYMRADQLSLTRAAVRAGTTPGAVLRHSGGALAVEGGRYRPTGSDRLLRVMRVFGTDGVETEVQLRSSRQASQVGEHWSAIGHYLETGDDSRLRALRGKTVAGIPLETDPELIDEWERRGELEIDDIYDLAA
jgi:hypothetical protein